MTEFWEQNFRDKQLMWGEDPARSALFARDYFLKQNAKNVLIPGIGYGRNAKPFVDAGMKVTGIEISETATALARSSLGLASSIHHGPVSAMPFSDETYDGIFSHALLHLLDEDGRKKFIKDCYAQLSPGGSMIITAISVKSPSYGKGVEIGLHQYEQHGGVQIFFYDETSMHQAFSSFGLVDIQEIAEPSGKDHSTELPFFVAVCRKE